MLTVYGYVGANAKPERLPTVVLHALDICRNYATSARHEQHVSRTTRINPAHHFYIVPRRIHDHPLAAIWRR